MKNNTESFKLKRNERQELWIEGILTMSLLILADFAIGNIIVNFIRHNQGVTDGIFIIKQSVTFGPFRQPILNWEGLFWFIMLIINGLIVWWRLVRIYKRIEISRIIDELHYISDGHFEHKIPFQLSGDNERVVKSVNFLVENVIKSMDDERRIEKSKDDLVTSASHDLRTPLTSIIGYLGLIEDHQYQSEADILKYCKIAYEKSQQMKLLVDQLFEYTKANNLKQRKLEMNPIDVNQLLTQLETSFALEASKRGIKIVVKPLKKDVIMSSNAELVGRVFNNLITNAISYGEGANKICLSAKVKGAQIQFTVANDGKRIPTSVIERIFERFYREESSRNINTGGSGLGLAIVKEIIQNQGGTINVNSTNKLTSFVFTLPIKGKQTD
ncbi:sensor histidine kinase [Fructilactobacillus sanfranciscensis]|uniref:sensor histidine kinase n=1 Tax=Fructilactobacillus sanfranciscensis TaxID=1625 RepID=UPI0013D1A822|nr:HAMP domain-containing sensor histidine kinase [Fructilactobacillus sanfranciscensis]MDN4462761.1 HAMP domain-containing histidine kinase [Fructilactobacillus sanfranciscensis]NDR61666.1 HAMP domain-containing histidine kinase [Fructilactobacillus sanfranciscensis]